MYDKNDIDKKMQELYSYIRAEVCVIRYHMLDGLDQKQEEFFRGLLNATEKYKGEECEEK